MITYKNGNLLESDCDIICHQVNLSGIFGGGLTYQIYEQYPIVEIKLQKTLSRNYNETVYSKKYDLEFAKFDYNVMKPKYIANIFSQDDNYNTQYDWLDIALTNLLSHLDKVYKSLDLKTLGFPYGYGCGIANGKWEEVEKILKKHFDGNTKYDCEIWKYEVK